MKKLICLVLIFFCFNLVQAQEKYDQIRSLKIAHLTSVMKLTKAEAEKFWPLYNTYDTKMHELRHREIVKYIRNESVENVEKLDDKSAKQHVEQLTSFDKDYSEVRIIFIKDAQKIISDKKILLLKKAEDDFNRKMLKKYRENK